jgi:3-hydroxyisobutyrate dehydrogenase-like beta-hydroxyacid dehydrogenase
MQMRGRLRSAMTPASPNRPDVAFIGLGALGSPMATNLLNAGFALHVHNRTAAAAEPLLAAGASWAADPAAAAARAEVLCLCLSDDAAVRAVLDAAQSGLRAGALVIDFSTISPGTSQALAAALSQQGASYIDAPVTGGTEGARAGTLSVLVGAAAADLERARPLLAVIGGRISHLGPVGAGQQAKAVNQVLVAGSYGAVAEALALAQRLGLPMDTLLEALRPGAAGSWALQHRADGMLAGHYPLGFKLALHRKDLAIALEAAQSQGLALPLSERIAAIEDALIRAGLGEQDVSALAEWFRE